MHRFSALSVLLLAIALAAPGAARAERVSFDELTPANDSSQALRDEYAHLGLHFVQSGATWGGMSAGDPGGWGLEGTLGPAFMGLDGPVYNLLLRFDWPVSALSFDMARSEPGPSGAMLVFGYRGGVFVESVTVPFPDAVDAWVSVELNQDVDIVVGLSRIGVPYGIDHLRWAGPLGDADQEIPVAIDILPGSERNPIQVGRRGVLPVVLFGAEDFDVNSVDPSTLRFGPGEAPLAHESGPHPGDHDGDGYEDWTIHHRVEKSGLSPADEEVCLVGETWEGVVIVGCDLVTPVGRR